MLSIIENIFEKLEASTEPYQLSIEIFNDFFDKFWDYPASLYVHSCKFVLNVCRIQGNMTKVTKLLKKSLGFLTKITEDIATNVDLMGNPDAKTVNPICAVAKAICESWKIITTQLKKQSYIEDFNQLFPTLVQVNDLQLQFGLFETFYELNRDQNQNEIVRAIGSFV